MAITKGWSYPASMGFAKGGSVRVAAHYRRGGHHKSATPKNVHTHLKHDAHDPEEGPMKHIKQHGGTSPLQPYKKGGMHINPAHKGKFTKRGISVEKGLHSKSKVVREEANFARMAKRHFKPLAKGGHVESTEKIDDKAPGFKERHMHEDARGGHVKMRHGGHVAGHMGHKDVHHRHEKHGHETHHTAHGHPHNGHLHYRKGGHHLPKKFREEEGHPHKMHKAAGGLAGIEPRTPRIGTRSRHMNPLRASISPGVRASSIRPMGGLGGVGVMKRGGKAGC